MGHSLIAATLVLGAATHSCVAFVPTFLGVISHPAVATCSSKGGDASISGGIGLGSHVCRNTRSRTGTLRWRSGHAGPLMMAKERKKGKGKAGRVELIERYGTEKIAGGYLSEAVSEYLYLCLMHVLSVSN